MKKIITLFSFIALTLNLHAQWSNTTNQFYDSLHMSVCTAAAEQANSRVVKSFPDSGYFVVWEDNRGGYYSNKQIYAQKYDKNGTQLWAVNGVPISAGTNAQHYTYSSNSDLRNYSVAASDSAGGFYISYADDSTTNYVWERVMVQHIRSDGSTVFPGAGFIIFTSNSANWIVAPQLLADGNKGFFIGYSYGGGGFADVYVYCYKDNNGTMQNYGGGQMDINAYEKPLGLCANYSIDFRDAYVSDYMIYTDLQKGCNITMTMAQNAGGNERVYTGYNWLWRAKKNSTAPSNDSNLPMVSYKKDSVITFYKVFSHTYRYQCGNESGDAYILDGNGYMQSSNEVYGAEHTKATVIPTDGNINVNIMAVNERRYLNNTLTDWFTHGFYRIQQKFDSIPYEYTVGPYYKPGFVGGPPPGQNKLGSYSAYGLTADTLLYEAGSSYFYDFNLAGGGNKVFAASLMKLGIRDVVLQGLQVQRITPDSFAVQLTTGNKNGIVIGKEKSAGVTTTDIYYNNPIITVDNNGNAVFYIREYFRSTRVSPIINGAELAWGAMGKPTGSGQLNGYYYPENPYVALDPFNGTGVISWNDQRTPPQTGNNIYMRHLDNLNVAGYLPPYKLIKLIPNPYSATVASPAVLLGTSKHFSTFEVNGSPVVDILDNYNLGNVDVTVYQNTGAIRTYNGKPYLDRNYSITPENNPNGAATINIRLFFTQTEFDALKTADPSIISPGDLAVIKQPATGAAPASYIFVAGEQTVLPQSWSAIPGGYYIEIAITGFSNFFIKKTLVAPLPIRFIDVQAQWQTSTQAKVSWQVADEQGVKEFVVQQSVDETTFTDACTVPASAQTNYNCIVTPAYQKNYYRVMELDIDGNKTYSKIVVLQPGASVLSAYPNPAKDKLYINGLTHFTTANMIDITCKIIRSVPLTSASNYINVSQLAAGIYFIRLTVNKEVRTLKFIKE